MTLPLIGANDSGSSAPVQSVATPNPKARKQRMLSHSPSSERELGPEDSPTLPSFGHPQARIAEFEAESDSLRTGPNTLQTARTKINSQDLCASNPTAGFIPPSQSPTRMHFFLLTRYSIINKCLSH
jgi:hypothetical protein